jgi:hypothetical protein
MCVALCIMSKEPSYLSHLGEFATLKNAIGSWYHQDAYLDFSTDEEIWADIFSGHDAEARYRLEIQLLELLGKSDETLIELWNSEAHSHSFTCGNEARTFLTDMLAYFKGQSKNA